MVARITDSEQYGHLWGTAEMRGVFDERARLQSWLDILVALARAQAALGIVPQRSADAIAAAADVERLDLEEVAAGTRATSHSTLGLIHAFQRVLPDEAREHVYLGATVQDLTDTWTGLVMGRVGAIVWRDLRTVEALLLDLAERHRATVMVGRTHGQPGAPITFGFKAASWADEARRSLERLHEGRHRWLVGQLAGAVGVLGFFGADGLELRRQFCAQVGLGDPGVSWLTSRDRVVDFAQVLALISGLLARIGGEVYELQRDEIGELREPVRPGTVSSITMPHKRNPERSEHLDTLARLVRANTGVLLEAMVQHHERDGRGWKAEWVAFPEVCLYTGAGLQLAIELLSGLEVDAARMAANLAARAASVNSEQLLAALSPEIGKHRAQAQLQSAYESGAARGLPPWPEGTEGAAGKGALVAAIAMADSAVARGRAARGAEADEWR
ncbi:MAG TPA: adenylosuccinate lyase family protein [Acidimicrobiales bacterium]|nr:adenylosuccinate lyase family protein [Acidimicrobiales bacterium]